MGAGQSQEVDPEVPEVIDEFIARALVRKPGNYVRMNNIVEQLVDLLPEITEDAIAHELSEKLPEEFVRHRKEDEEWVPDVIIDHILISLDPIDETLDAIEELKDDATQKQDV